MRIITPFDQVGFANPVVTVGTFDGVHIGHAAVIQSVICKAAECAGTPLVLTFDPHPRKFIDGIHAPGLLTTLPEKKDRFEALGLENLAVVPFDDALRQLTPERFVEHYLVSWLHTKHVVVGYDHGFGKDRQGGFETMQKMGAIHGFEVSSVPPNQNGSEPISSTRIRQALQDNRFSEAIELLGRGYPVWGVVEKGDGRGTGLGFPTANVCFDPKEKLSPPEGVYAARVYLDREFPAVVNFGRRPTFQGHQWAFEVHILGFSGDLYGQELRVDLVAQIRAERKFENQEALVAQIKLDVSKAEQMLSQSSST